MTTEYSYDKQLIKDFIHFISDNHRCAVVEFPDEFASSQYVNYRFVNVLDMIDEFVEEKNKSHTNVPAELEISLSVPKRME